MSAREIDIAGRKLFVHERADAYATDTGKALTGSWLWDSSLILAEFITYEKAINLTGKRVLELGAGVTGIPGLTAAALRASKVVLTDIPQLVPELHRNIESNNELFYSNGCTCVHTRELIWGRQDEAQRLVEEEFKDSSSVDVVLLSDVFYDEEDMEALAETLRAVWGDEKEKTIVLAATEMRYSSRRCLEKLAKFEFSRRGADRSQPPIDSVP